MIRCQLRECRTHPVTVHTILVNTVFMRNITFSANEDLIDQARQIAADQRKTLNDAFRDWLAQYASSRSDAAGFDEFMSRIKPMRAGRHFTRDEMYEPKNGSRSSLELVIFFKVKLLAAIDDFTIWARCGAVENR